MLNRKIAVGAILLAGLLVAGGAYAFFGGGPGMHAPLYRAFNDDAQAQLETALLNNDFDAFKQVYASRGLRFPERLSEERFNEMANRAIEKQKVERAIETGDYATWKTTMESSGRPHTEYLLSIVTAENFHLLKDLHDAQEARDFETMRAISEELGLYGPGVGNCGMHKAGKGVARSVAGAPIDGYGMGMRGFANPGIGGW